MGFFLIDTYLIYGYNVVLVSGIQQNDSFFFFFQILFHSKLLPDIERVPCLSYGSARSHHGRGGGEGTGKRVRRISLS